MRKIRKIFPCCADVLNRGFRAHTNAAPSPARRGRVRRVMFVRIYSAAALREAAARGSSAVDLCCRQREGEHVNLLAHCILPTLMIR